MEKTHAPCQGPAFPGCPSKGPKNNPVSSFLFFTVSHRSVLVRLPLALRSCEGLVSHPPLLLRQRPSNTWPPWREAGRLLVSVHDLAWLYPEAFVSHGSSLSVPGLPSRSQNIYCFSSPSTTGEERSAETGFCCVDTADTSKETGQTRCHVFL